MKLSLSPFSKALIFGIVCLSACIKTREEIEITYRPVATFSNLKPNARPANAANYSAFAYKLAHNIPIKIACEGTSLTYGQNVPGVSPPINGASQTRALYQYPSTLQSALNGIQMRVNVINRGFPGDRTIEGLTRWKDSTLADVCILEYGTNDAFNFAGYADGTIDTAHFHLNLLKLVQRRLNEGSYVILVSPPQLNPVNPALNTYKTVIARVGTALNIKVFDVADFMTVPEDYFDGVHLTASGYRIWGENIANLIRAD
jgi:lysophospholipase L1-like esterase